MSCGTTEEAAEGNVNLALKAEVDAVKQTATASELAPEDEDAEEDVRSGALSCGTAEVAAENAELAIEAEEQRVAQSATTALVTPEDDEAEEEKSLTNIKGIGSGE